MSFFELTRLKNEIVSSLSFLQENFLLESTYDGSIRLYNNISVQDPSVVSVLAEISAPSPVLSVTHTESGATIMGLADGTLRLLDFENIRVSPSLLGNRSASNTDNHSYKNGIHFCKSLDQNTIIAASFNGELWLADLRSPLKSAHYKPNGKIFAIDTTSQFITLGKSQQKIEIYDARRVDLPYSERSTGLRFPITALKNFPDGESYAISSIDGRVSIDLYSELESASKRKFAFKSHREYDPALGVDMVYPVTDLVFHPVYSTLFTSGGDGHICIWNCEKRKRMKQLPTVPYSKLISHMSMNKDGTVMALSVCQDSFLRGQTEKLSELNESRIFIRPLAESECKPK